MRCVGTCVSNFGGFVKAPSATIFHYKPLRAQESVRAGPEPGSLVSRMENQGPGRKVLAEAWVKTELKRKVEEAGWACTYSKCDGRNLSTNTHCYKCQKPKGSVKAATQSWWSSWGGWSSSGWSSGSRWEGSAAAAAVSEAAPALGGSPVVPNGQLSWRKPRGSASSRGVKFRGLRGEEVPAATVEEEQVEAWRRESPPHSEAEASLPRDGGKSR